MLKLNQLQATIAKIPQKILSIEKFFTLHFCAKKLDKKDFFGSSDPFLQIFKTRKDSEPVKVFESEVIKMNLNPVWKPISKMPLQDICGGELDKKLLFKVFDWNRFNDASLIGEFEASIQDIINANPKSFPLINKELQQKKKKYEKSGTFEVSKILVESLEVQIPNPEYNDIGSAITQTSNTLYQLQSQEREKYKNQYRPFVSPYSLVQFLAGGLELSFIWYACLF